MDVWISLPHDKEVEKATEEKTNFVFMAPSSSLWYFPSPPNEVSFRINFTFPAIWRQGNAIQHVNAGLLSHDETNQPNGKQ